MKYIFIHISILILVAFNLIQTDEKQSIQIIAYYAVSTDPIKIPQNNIVLDVFIPDTYGEITELQDRQGGETKTIKPKISYKFPDQGRSYCYILYRGILEDTRFSHRQNIEVRVNTIKDQWSTWFTVKIYHTDQE